MHLFTEQQQQQLSFNGAPENRDNDHTPVVRLFVANTSMVWLLNELDPERPSEAFGLCDLGMGFPELGYLDLEGVSEVCSRNQFSLERDLHFNGKYPMSVYAEAARQQQRITTDERDLMLALQALCRPKPRP
ncbi:DUF2958 domain-containing protein [Rurimicrobium arvi]|uniref:DUF2958 domain-containing protein n=2 Tax=Rurimicrobium arvi TaxID=2049916 RepID=A0ABP8MXR6_9BACT